MRLEQIQKIHLLAVTLLCVYFCSHCTKIRLYAGMYLVINKVNPISNPDDKTNQPLLCSTYREITAGGGFEE